ncbi:cobalamin biosynthesis protein CobW [Clostridia bacterium]|nr:cobalamin biosynthesis protein CobW [Clostridia bacterium]
MIKIDIVSGFLGAGKTTFVCRLLKYYLARGERPVYIVNEFGQTGLDADIVRAENFNAVELSGGCVCCTLRGETAAAISRAIAAYAPTRIVFEPSGIFVFENFSEALRNPALKDICELGSVVTVVDGVNFKAARAPYGGFVYNQIRNAPALFISKADQLRAAGRDVQGVVRVLRMINRVAVIAAVSPAELDDAVLEELLLPAPEISAGHMHAHDTLQSFTITPEKPFTKERADRFAERCTDGTFGALCRVKGAVRVDGEILLFNAGIGDARFCPAPGLTAGAVTFIGSEIDADKIREFFAGKASF